MNPRLAPILSAVSVALVLGTSAPARAAEPVVLEGLSELRNISGVARIEGGLVVVDDQRNAIFVLRKEATNRFKLAEEVEIRLEDDDEVDLQAIAAVGNQIWTTGSHSLKRPPARKGISEDANLSRLLRVKVDAARDSVFRTWRDDASNRVESPTERWSLRKLVEANMILSRFSEVPGRENGFDVEGLAARTGGKLYFGLRSPVLGGGFVPVLVTTYGGSTSDLYFLQLYGLGIRDLVSTGDGFLVLAGPAGTEQRESRIVAWDGEHQLPGETESNAPKTLIEFGWREDGAMPEALTVLDRSGGCFRVLVLFDGVPGGAPETHDVCPGS